MCTDTDRAVCSWPWQSFAQDKADRSLFVTSNRRIPFKNTFCWIALRFCACDNTFIVTFYVVRAVRRFDLCLLQTKHLTNGDQRKSQAITKSLHYFDTCILHSLLFIIQPTNAPNPLYSLANTTPHTTPRSSTEFKYVPDKHSCNTKTGESIKN